MSSKTLCNQQKYIDADYNIDNLSRLLLNFTPPHTQMHCENMFGTFYYQSLLNSPGLSVVSGPLNVFKDTKG